MIHEPWRSSAASYAPQTVPCTQATSDTQFAEYTPKTAFLFPGQGAQTVGMAKVRSQGLRLKDSAVSEARGSVTGGLGTPRRPLTV